MSELSDCIFPITSCKFIRTLPLAPVISGLVNKRPVIKYVLLKHWSTLFIQHVLPRFRNSAKGFRTSYLPQGNDAYSVASSGLNCSTSLLERIFEYSKTAGDTERASLANAGANHVFSLSIRHESFSSWKVFFYPVACRTVEFSLTTGRTVD
jgi:hypothetical protein